MKKCLLFLAMAMLSATASAQFTVWEDDFNDGDVSDWNLLDLDGNSSNWLARTNLTLNADNTAVIDGPKDILGTYNVDFITLQYLETAENNWAISPAIDLSYYGGTMSLVMNAQPAIVESGQPFVIKVYASLSAEPSSFVLIGDVTMLRISEAQDEFMDYSVDFSQFSGQSQVYFALAVTKPSGFVGAEIDNIRIDAESILGIKDNEGTKPTVIKQNPVTENVQLQLGTTVNAAQLKLQVYNVNGMLIKEAPYSEAGLRVDDLSSGMYFVVLTDGNATERLKFIKK